MLGTQATASSFVTPDLSGADLGVRLAINLVCVGLLIRGIYFRTYRRADLFLTFFAFNLVIFLITFLMNRVEMTLGAAFGLFAVFSMLRYRTEGISAKDMTYLFMVIALGLIMAVSHSGWIELGFIGATIVIGTLLLEGSWVTTREHAQEVLYDNIQLIAAHARPELIGDLKNRTGLNIHRVDIREIDLLKDSARLTVFYRA